MHYHNYEDLLKNNLEWAQEKLSQDPAYFENLAKGQKPPF